MVNLENKIQFGLIDERKIKILEVINLQCLPVVYVKSTYQKIIDLYLEYSRFAYFNDIVVGSIVTRLEPRFNLDSCYILTFCVLEAYRRCKIGQKILEELLNILPKSVKGIYLHVQISNETAINFYKKMGFQIIETCENYYTDIEPNDAFLLQKLINQE